MLETLQKFLVRRRVSGNSSVPPLEPQLGPDQRAQLRKMLDSEAWADLAQRYQDLWVSALSRLINETDPSKLSAIQAEVRTLEKVISLPTRLLEVSRHHD